jgi:DNA-binding CsgD family transcriptional regulator
MPPIKIGANKQLSYLNIQRNPADRLFDRSQEYLLRGKLLVTDPVFEIVDGTKLLVDLQQVNSIVTSFSGCLEPVEIADKVTAGLVEKFGCVFARIWLMGADRTMLKLVASAGLYQRTNGFFARVPVGAFKVGKIAQNQIPFLSNQLAAEAWVLDRDWAISHGIQGFAGYPLIVDGDSIGVIAVFSQTEMLPEFLEILQSLCTATTIGLAAALRYQEDKLTWRASSPPVSPQIPLSEQIANVLKPTPLALVGTERLLPLPLQNLSLRAAEVLSQLPCSHSRLTYTLAADRDRLTLDVTISGSLVGVASPSENRPKIAAALETIRLEAICLGGTLEIQPHTSSHMFRVLLTVISIHRQSPMADQTTDLRVNLRCRASVLQMAFSHVIELAGLTVAPIINRDLPLVTDDRSLVETTPKLLWIATDDNIPSQARGQIDLSISPSELRSAVETVMLGERWGITTKPDSIELSDREREIMNLLTQGLRDRDIATQLIVSESTVKFHINNILAKLKAKTRFQALYQAIYKGLI